MVILDLRHLDTLMDFFVICTADVDPQVRAVVRHVEQHTKETTGDRVLHREGMEGLNWVLLDYVDVVVHVFKPSFREFYRLETLWGDAEILTVEDGAADKPKPVRRRRIVEPEVEKPAAAPRTSTRKAPAAKTTTRSSAGGKRKPAAKTSPAKSSTRRSPGRTKK